ncbi:GNAT family N-acetyltransferase [Algibacter sp. L4_22]|uniref:GNAT family N-acetyltransferase n=1 Tax=Algibacter sp. L4_22 TaxID=2942477 RepID=UPI00201B4C02|nr:GNAT family N-acetyltransferase [Algibacter sp. L4_22]MCL5130276.1 GNAT family N-acetyltransferase [Algibacter sp. L4_22]
MKILRTNSENKDFIKLVKLLDLDLAIRDGEDHSFYAQFNKTDSIKHVIVVYKNNIPLGCGAIKEYDNNAMEIKRMFTSIESRGIGIASLILNELEKWARELLYKKCILETGIKQPEAIGLYEKNGYKLILNYGQYANIENSKCFEKVIIK